VRVWETAALDVAASEPAILSSTDAARVVVLQLPAGQRLEEHQVHERAFLLVIAGEVEVDPADGDAVTGGPGLLAEFDPGELHEVRATADARLLLLLAPWPGDGHPGAMSLDAKARARESAREHAGSS
jgi:quercetin dioxygenase-like cupin family protein